MPIRFLRNHDFFHNNKLPLKVFLAEFKEVKGYISKTRYNFWTNNESVSYDDDPDYNKLKKDIDNLLWNDNDIYNRVGPLKRVKLSGSGFLGVLLKDPIFFAVVWETSYTFVVAKIAARLKTNIKKMILGEGWESQPSEKCTSYFLLVSLRENETDYYWSWRFC